MERLRRIYASDSAEFSSVDGEVIHEISLMRFDKGRIDPQSRILTKASQLNDETLYQVVYCEEPVKLEKDDSKVSPKVQNCKFLLI